MRIVPIALFAALVIIAVLFANDAKAQLNEKVIEGFRVACRAQVRAQGRPREEIPPLVRNCVQARIAAAKKRDLEKITQSAPSSLGGEVQLHEFLPWLVKSNRGPGEAKGIIYFVRGWGRPRRGGESSDDFQLAPYFIKGLADDGWDVLLAKFPNRPTSLAGFEVAAPAARFVQRRTAELKKQGYRRVIVGGHSWGAWVTLLAEQSGSLNADALLLVSPNTHGPKILPIGKNPRFERETTEFSPLVRAIKSPTVLVEIDRDDHEPGGRSEVATTLLQQQNVPHLVIDKPAGFGGHFGGWLPVFDFAFGRCIQRFLDSAKAATCWPPPLSNEDFRSVVNIRQVADAEQKLVASGTSLAGRKFAAYDLDEVFQHFDYVTPVQRELLTVYVRKREAISFGNGLHCVAKACTKLVRWSDSEVLQFDPASGNLKAWWVGR